jgi:hypothetical protein
VVVELIVESRIPMAATPIIGSPMVEINEEEEPIANHEEEEQQPPIQDVPHMNLLEDLRGPEGRLSLKTTRFMLAKKFKWRVIPPLLKKP